MFKNTLQYIEKMNSRWWNSVKTIISYSPIVGLLLWLMSMPFSYGHWQRTSLYIASIGYVLDYLLNKRWKCLCWNRDNYMYISMFLLFIMIPLWQLWDTTAPTEYYYHQLNRHTAFAIIGVVGCLGFSDKLKLKYAGYAMLLTSIYMLIVNTYYYFTQYGVLNFDYILYNNVRAQYINSHMVVNLYINTTIILGVYILRTVDKKVVKVALPIVLLLLFSYVILSVGRSGFLSALLILLIVSTSYFTKYHNKKVLYVLLTIVFFVVSILFLANPRLDMDVMLHNPRLVVWEYSLQKIAEKPILGYGVSTFSSDYLQQMYQDENTYNNFIRGLLSIPDFAAVGKSMMTHHPHNTFLTEWIEFGIIGLLVLVFFMVSVVMMPKREYRLYVWCFLLAVFIQMMFEPLGDHLQPQFIAVVLLLFQRSCGHSNRKELSYMGSKEAEIPSLLERENTQTAEIEHV